MTARTARTIKLPEPTDIHRDELDAFVTKLGHDPRKVLRIRIHPRVVEVDLLPPRRDVSKLTVTHQVLRPEGDDES